MIYFTSKRMLAPLIGTLMALALFFRLYLSFHGVNWYVVYRLPYCHMDVLLAGAAVAVLLRSGTGGRKAKASFLAATAIGFCGLIALTAINASNVSHVSMSLAVTCTALLFGGLVGLCARMRLRARSGILDSPFLRAISTRSYAMYVFHLVPLYISVRLLTRLKLMPLDTWAALIAIVVIGLVTYGLAWISWRYFEEPILRLKKWEWFAKPSTFSANSRS